MENAVFAKMARGDALKMLNLMNPAMEFKCNMKGGGYTSWGKHNLWRN